MAPHSPLDLTNWAAISAINYVKYMYVKLYGYMYVKLYPVHVEI